MTVKRAPSPKISVIIPCFNLGEFLVDAVDSVLAQTEGDFEILVVDDGSTDQATRALLQDLRRPKTQVFTTANQGLAGARNFLISRASGQYLCALDADDLLVPTFFEKAGEVLDTDSTVTFVSSWLEAFGEESWLWKKDRCDLEALLAEDTVMTAALVRRSAVVDIGGYDEQMPHAGDEDWDLWLRLVAAGHRGVILPEVLFRYRRREGSMSRMCVEGETHLDLMRYMMDKHEDLYREKRQQVLLLKERDIGGYLRHNDAAERRLAEQRATLARRQDWLEHLRSRAAIPQVKNQEEQDAASQCLNFEARLIAQAEEYRRSRAEIAQLRDSWSWRMTGGLRWLAEVLGLTGAGR